MENKTKLRILMMGTEIPDPVLRHLGEYDLQQAIHPYQIRAILSSEVIDYIFVPVREWNPTSFLNIHEWKQLPKLILLQDHLDKMDDQSVTRWREPYTQRVLDKLLSTDIIASPDDYQVIYQMSNRKIIRIAFADILLIRKQPQSQVLVHTRQGDYLLYESLRGFMQLLPEGRFERISDTLIIPVQSRRYISKRGFAFRGGHIPITTRFIAFQNRQVHEDLI